MLYQIEQLKKDYARRTVLDIPALSVEAGRIYGLLGPNGAGKTTLLNIMGFLDAPSSGQVRFRGKAVRYVESVLQPLRRAVVMLDQHPVLFTANVYKNLEFGLKVRGLTRLQRDQAIDEALDLVGMRDFIAAPAHRLSGGETQRVALARALALSPDVLLCDEPTASVDSENQTAIIRILQRINRERRITILFTSHDRFQAARLAQEVLFLERGQLSPAGTDNIFAANHRRAGDTGMTVTIQEILNMSLPPTDIQPAGASARILIDPTKIEIVSENGDEDAPNTFRGKVIQIAEDRDFIRLVVDVGAWFALYLSMADYQRQRPLVGMPIVIRIPPHAVQYM